MPKRYLSVIIPAYNEERNLKKGVLNRVVEYLKQVKYSYEVIIVNDGSTDKTSQLIKNFIKNKQRFSAKGGSAFGWHLIESPHGGKALAVMTGLLAAKGEIALFTDMDQATPLPEVEKFFQKFKEGLPAARLPDGQGRQGYDIVIGSRKGRKGAPLIRKLAAWGFAALRNLILGLPFSDTQCGFKAFNKKSREAIFLHLKEIWEKMRAKGAAVHAGFDIETLFIARKKGLKIAEVPVNWHYVGTERVQLIKDSIDAIKDMVRIRLNDLMGRY